MGWLTAHERGAGASLLPASGPMTGHPAAIVARTCGEPRFSQ